MADHLLQHAWKASGFVLQKRALRDSGKQQIFLLVQRIIALEYQEVVA